MKKTLSIIILFLLAMQAYQYARAEPAVNCHCFRNRTFNPENRFAADDYLLTTVFNSLIAGYFGIEKRSIVMWKMKGGVRNEDLLTALYISRHTNTEVNELLDMKKNKSWQRILEEKQIKKPFNEDPVYKLLTEESSDTQVADRITAEMLSDLFGVHAEDLDKMIAQGLTWRQLGLALTLADYTGADMHSIISLRQQKLSWSEIAHNFGLEPSQAGEYAEKQSRRNQ